MPSDSIAAQKQKETNTEINMTDLAYIPDVLLTPDMLQAYADWVRILPLDNATKKRLMMAWSQETGVQLTADDYRRAIPDEPYP